MPTVVFNGVGTKPGVSRLFYLPKFDSIKHINEYGEEYWSARELIPLLEYNEYRFFKKVIDKAINACEATDNKASDHFVQVNEMVTILKMRIIRIMS